jgi:hypothetical protein
MYRGLARRLYTGTGVQPGGSRQVQGSSQEALDRYRGLARRLYTGIKCQEALVMLLLEMHSNWWMISY